MACPSGSDDRSTSEPQRQNHHDSHRKDENPFVAFRRYADQQVSSLLQSVIGLPSAVFTPATRDWQVFRDRDVNGNVYRWCHPSDGRNNDNTSGQGYNGSRDGNFGAGSDANADWGDRRYPSNLVRRQQDDHDFPSAIFDSVMDHIFASHPMRWFDNTPRMEVPSLFGFDAMGPWPSPGFPVGYLLFSPYSPLQLERQQRLEQRLRERGWTESSAPWSFSQTHERSTVKQPRWREAFEDLLRVDNGQDMLDWSSTTDKDEESEKEWLSGMIRRGSFGEGWTHVPSRNGRSGDFFQVTGRNRNSQDGLDRSGDQDTELGLYELFLRQANEDFDKVDGSRPSSIMNALQESSLGLARELEELRKPYDELRQRQRRESYLTSETEMSDDRKQSRNARKEGDETEESQLQWSSHSASQPSRIVSTSTRTERHQLPDGSWRSKTVTNHRFEDGREKTFEKDEITHSKQDHVASENNAQNRTNNSGKGDSEDNEKGGWFWAK